MRTPTTGWNENPRREYRRVQKLTYVAALCLIAAVCVVLVLQPAGAQQQEQEPIVTTGHGGFFGPDGRQIPVTRGFVARAQAWYRNKLLSELSAVKRREFADYERRLFLALDTDPQERLIVRHQALEWLLANIQSVDLKRRTAAKLRALRYAMNWKLPEQADLKIVEKRQRFVPRPEVTRRLESLRLSGLQHHPVTGTSNSGQAYIDECIAAGVPIPPTINRMDAQS